MRYQMPIDVVVCTWVVGNRWVAISELRLWERDISVQCGSEESAHLVVISTPDSITINISRSLAHKLGQLHSVSRVFCSEVGATFVIGLSSEREGRRMLLDS